MANVLPALPVPSPAPIDKRFLPPDKRILVASTLTEGNSVRGTARIAKCDKNTVLSFGLRIGEGRRRVRRAGGRTRVRSTRWSFGRGTGWRTRR